jgi:hypothetical protein
MSPKSPLGNVQLLNKHTKVAYCENIESVSETCDVVICAGASLQTMAKINELCRKVGVKHIFTYVRGVCGLVGVDYGSRANHRPLVELLATPQFAPLNECAAGRDDQCRSRALLSALLVAEDEDERGDRVDDGAGNEWMEQVALRYQQLNRDTTHSVSSSFPLDADDLTRLRRSLRQGLLQCPATAAVLGGVAAQEAIRALAHSSSHRISSDANGGEEESVEQRLLLFEALSALPLTHTDLDELLANAPGEDATRLYGAELMIKLKNLSVLVAGAGAIGCELIKNFALLHVGEETGGSRGQVYVVDPDSIERSNLNRQLLYR